MVGHHSESRHRRDIARADCALGNAVQADQAARAAAERARSSGYAIQVRDDDATEALAAKVERLEATHAHYTRHNKEARKGTHTISQDCPGCQMIADKGKYMRTEGIRLPPYVLNNSRGRIKQAKEQLAKAHQVAARKAAATEAGQDAEPIVEGEGWTIRDDIAQDRVRIYFDGKPAHEVRAIVKNYGFRWSPRATAWQRQNTPSGIFAARQVAAALTQEAHK